MTKSRLGYKYILLCTCESTNWVVGIPIADEQAETIADALFYKVICVYGTPKAIICDEAPAFTSTLMQAYFHTLNIQPYYRVKVPKPIWSPNRYAQAYQLVKSTEN